MNWMIVVGFILLFAWIPFAFFSTPLVIMDMIAAFIFLGYGASREKDRKEKEKAVREKQLWQLLSEQDFQSDQKVYNQDKNKLLAINEANSKLCIIGVNKDVSIYNFNDVLETHIIEDGESVTKTSRGSQIGGALIGGVLAGGVGAIIGGLSGSQTTENKVKRLELGIVVNDAKKPFRTFDIFNEELSVNKKDERYKNAKEKVDHWYNLIKVFIQKADKEDQKEETNNSNSSVVDELIKLSQLQKDGILTREEFEMQKQKLMS